MPYTEIAWPVGVGYAYNSAIRRLTQEDYLQFKISMNYAVITRIGRDAQQNSLEKISLENMILGCVSYK